MPGGWAGSTRSARLPPDWPQRRREVLERDGHQCQLRGPRCIGAASEVDHRQRGDSHELANLQAACPPCHRGKTSSEGHAARPSRRRPQPVHPGRAQARGAVPAASTRAPRHREDG